MYRARKSAEKVIDGDDNEQYNRIWDYCETLKATNVGTTTLCWCIGLLLMWQLHFKGYTFVSKLQRKGSRLDVDL